MLNPIGKICVLNCNKTGIKAHNIYNWIIKGNKFELSTFNSDRDSFALATKNFMSKINEKRREVIINYIYELIKRRELDISNFDLTAIKKLINSSPNLKDIEKEELIKYVKVFIKVSLPEIGKK
jgi:hypothetical protein